MRVKKLFLLNLSFMVVLFLSYFISDLSYNKFAAKEDIISSEEKDPIVLEHTPTIVDQPNNNIRLLSYSPNYNDIDESNYSHNTIEEQNIKTTNENSQNDKADNTDKINQADKTHTTDTPSKKTKQKKEKPKYSKLGVSIAKEYVNIRDAADINGKILGKLYKDSVATIIKTDGDWYKIKSGSIEGFVNKKFIKTGLSDSKIIKNYSTPQVKVNPEGLNVRLKPNEDSKKVAVIYKDETYDIIKEDNDWIKINIPSYNTNGFVKKEFISIINTFSYAVKYKEQAETIANDIQAIKNMAINSSDKKQDTNKTEVGSAMDSTTDEVKLLACLIYSEAGSQSYEGKLAVANVVLNRVKSKKYPNSISKVIYQKGQFSVAASGILSKNLHKYNNFNSSSQKACIKAATEALSGTNNVGSRLYFNSYKAAVNQGHDKKSNSIKIDGQLFW